MNFGAKYNDFINAYVPRSWQNLTWNQETLLFSIPSCNERKRKGKNICSINESVQCIKHSYVSWKFISKMHLLLQSFFKNTPHSNHQGYMNKPAGGSTGADPTSEVHQAHNSFLSASLISLEPRAPVGNWAGRIGKTFPYELAASDHSNYHQTSQTNLI